MQSPAFAYNRPNIRPMKVKVGVPKEIKDNEYRVAVLPVGAEELTRRGHEVTVQAGAGQGSGFSDEEYRKAGARISKDAAEIWRSSDLIVKVKEPLPAEYPRMREGQTLFTYFHFAASKELTQAVIKRGIVAIAYETVRTDKGELPLLTPMSEIAGRMAIQEGAKYLKKPMEGQGILLGGVPGVSPAHVTVIGGGIVGANAAKVAAGLGARVSILDVNLNRLRYLGDVMPRNVITLMSNAQNIREQVKQADLLIGAVLIEGARAPMLVTRAMIKTMKPGAVIVDVAVDQGGCIETTHATTHARTYIVDGVVHYRRQHAGRGRPTSTRLRTPRSPTCRRSRTRMEGGDPMPLSRAAQRRPRPSPTVRSPRLQAEIRPRGKDPGNESRVPSL